MKQKRDRGKPRIRDISKSTGYSPATVSNALNNKKNVKSETADKIFAAARELGYSKEASIKKIKLVMLRKEGSIIENSPFFPQLISGFERTCRDSGYEVLLYDLDAHSPSYERMVQTIIHDTTCAHVLLATEMNSDDLQAFRGAESPLVVLDSWTDDMAFSSVVINNEDSSFLACEHVIENGHTHIGYIASSFRVPNFESRRAGFDRAMRKHGLVLDERDIIWVTANIESSNVDTVRFLSERQESLPLPTAFVAENDLMALGAMRGFQESGLSVPRDISVVGFDDIAFAALSSPPLSTIQVPRAELGSLGAMTLIHILKGEQDCVVRTQLCTSFVARKSVRKMRRPAHPAQPMPAKEDEEDVPCDTSFTA